jgi:acetyl esterase/lipase
VRLRTLEQIVMGDSAGGGLSLALVMYLRDAGYEHLLPRAMVLMSPWVDLTMSCGSWDENATTDPGSSVSPRLGG